LEITSLPLAMWQIRSPFVIFSSTKALALLNAVLGSILVD
jgi:hypothetical protein